MGPAPFGYINKITESGKKYIEPKEPEASILKWAFNEVATTRNSIIHIWELAKAKGLRCCKNSLWFIIRNPVYCGKIYVSKLKDEDSCYVEGQHEGIISESLFYKVQDILDGKKSLYSSKKETQDMQLRGYLICPLCGRLLTGSASKGRSLRYLYYHCISPCKTRFNAHEANDKIVTELRKYVPKPGMADMYKEIINQLFKQSTKAQRDDLKLIKDQLEQENIHLSKARDLLLSSEIDPSDYRIIKASCEKKISVLESKLFDRDSSEYKIDHLLENAVNVIGKLDRLYIDGDIRKKRQIIGSIYPEKLIFDGINYRTARLNEAIELIYSIDKGFNERKNGQTPEIIDLSKQVTRPGFEPRHSDPESDVLPLYYRAMGLQI